MARVDGRRACLSAAALVLATAAAVAGPASAASALGTTSATARLNVSVVIAPVLRLRTSLAPRDLEITAADVAAGYVDVGRAVEMEIVSNLRHGHVLQVRLADPLVRSADVAGLGEPVRVSGSLASIAFPRAARGAMRSALRLGFRLYLAEGATPGRYPWPVQLTLVPA